MPRSWRWRSERQYGWTTSVNGRPMRTRIGGPVLAATPDPDGRLAEGVRVEGRVLARLLGVRLLRLDAEVVLVPARLDEPLRPASPPRPAHPAAPPRPAQLGGPSGLAEARRLVAECQHTIESLQQSRASGS